MCSIIVQLQILNYLRSSLPPLTLEAEQPSPWQPWHHLQPWPKGSPYPTYNPQGKYCVKLYWMVCTCTLYIHLICVYIHLICVYIHLIRVYIHLIRVYIHFQLFIYLL